MQKPLDKRCTHAPTHAHGSLVTVNMAAGAGTTTVDTFTLFVQGYGYIAADHAVDIDANMNYSALHSDVSITSNPADAAVLYFSPTTSTVPYAAVRQYACRGNAGGSLGQSGNRCGPGVLVDLHTGREVAAGGGANSAQRVQWQYPGSGDVLTLQNAGAFVHSSQPFTGTVQNLVGLLNVSAGRTAVLQAVQTSSRTSHMVATQLPSNSIAAVVENARSNVGYAATSAPQVALMQLRMLKPVDVSSAPAFGSTASMVSTVGGVHTGFYNSPSEGAPVTLLSGLPNVRSSFPSVPLVQYGIGTGALYPPFYAGLPSVHDPLFHAPYSYTINNRVLYTPAPSVPFRRGSKAIKRRGNKNIRVRLDNLEGRLNHIKRAPRGNGTRGDRSNAPSTTPSFRKSTIINSPPSTASKGSSRASSSSANKAPVPASSARSLGSRFTRRG